MVNIKVAFIYMNYKTNIYGIAKHRHMITPVCSSQHKLPHPAGSNRYILQGHTTVHIFLNRLIVGSLVKNKGAVICFSSYALIHEESITPIFFIQTAV